MQQTSLLYPVSSASRRCQSLDGMWKFQFDPGSIGLADGWTAGLPDPVSMPVPSSFCDLFTDKESREYCGDFWYESDFFVPGEWSGRDIVLRFGSATHRAHIYVNGTEVASHEGGFLTSITMPVSTARSDCWHCRKSACSIMKRSAV